MRYSTAAITGGAAIVAALYLAPTLVKGYEEPQAGYGTSAVAPRIIESPTLDVVTLNVAHARGTALNQLLVSATRHRNNLEKIATTLLNTGAQVAALQEADAPSLWSGSFDHVEYLAREMDYLSFVHGYHADAWPFTYGTVLMSNFNMFDVHSHRFQPSWPTASKGFVRGTVLWQSDETPAGPRPVTLVSVHLDFSRESVRDAQIGELVAHLENLDTPVVILGDFNSDWSNEGSPVRQLARALNLSTFRPIQPGLGTYKIDERLDWILISDDLDFIEHNVLPDVISDHLAVYAKIGWKQ